MIQSKRVKNVSSLLRSPLLQPQPCSSLSLFFSLPLPVFGLSSQLLHDIVHYYSKAGFSQTISTPDRLLIQYDTNNTYYPGYIDGRMVGELEISKTTRGVWHLPLYHLTTFISRFPTTCRLLNRSPSLRKKLQHKYQISTRVLASSHNYKQL